ncbi:MAG: Inorganic phosphate transporter pho84 [Chaenotheca gracillima]|nr:MAG: Inorganic phosphate transporter pho84 [Chaenotheca gracillima]
MEETNNVLTKNWDTDRFTIKDFGESVITVHVCGYVNEKNEGDEEGNPPTNHWASFLANKKSGSVRLDKMPGYGSDGLRGKIEISSKPYESTKNDSMTLSFPAIVQTTVKDVTDMINRKGRDKYTFTEEMEGCRHWIWTLISDLEAEGIIDTGSGEATLKAVSSYWRFPSGSEPRAIKQGSFY